MKTAEFIQLLSEARKQHGYKFKFHTQCRLIPCDPADFKSVPAYCVRGSIGGDPRAAYPVEIVWFCFFSAEGEDRLPGPAHAAKLIGLNEKRSLDIMAAGEEYWVPLRPRRNKIAELRDLLLKASGLKEVEPRALDMRKPFL